MDVLEWLNNVKKLDRLIEAKTAERERLIELATDISAKAPDGMPFSNTGTVNQKMQNAVVDLVVLEQELKNVIASYIQCKGEIISTLEKLPANEYAVLHRFYIRYMTYEEIAEDLGISTVQVWRIKKKGEKTLSDVIECNT